MNAAADIIILGAGLAGLAAADRLSSAGKSVLLLEARGRTGGRVWTTHDAYAAFPVELGAEWVEGAGQLRALLDQHEAAVRESIGHRVERQGATLVRRGWSQDEVDSLVARVGEHVATGEDRPLLEVLNSFPTHEVPPDARQQLLGYVAGYHAADPARVSARWLVQVEETEPADASSGRASRGLDRAVHALTARITSAGAQLTLNAVVRDVHWSRGRVTVHADVDGVRESCKAVALICALPLSILKLRSSEHGSVTFTPPLDDKRDAMDHLETGEARKVALLFDEPLWQNDASMRDALFLQDFQQPIPTWWTTDPLELPMLTGWLAGPAASHVAHANAEHVLGMAIDSLAGALALPSTQIRALLRAWHSHDWSADPFARGAYSYILSGGLDAPAQLARPIDRTLYFAGEATCEHGHNATMEGAFRSGYRAADELLAGV